MLSLRRNFQSLSFLVALLAAFSGICCAQEATPARLRAIPQWTPGEKATYQVQQVVKERVDGKEETKFLANGTMIITAVDIDADSVTFSWHRSMDNAELEMVREPWGIRGNESSSKLINNLFRAGIPLKVRLDLNSQRLTFQNRDEVAESIRKNLQGVGGGFSGRAVAPPSVPSGNPQAGIYRPLVKYDNTRAALTPRSAGGVAHWYWKIAELEIHDFLGALGREYVPDSQAKTAPSAAQTFRPAGANAVLLTLTSAPAHTAARDLPATEDEKEGEPTSVGLSGGASLPAAYEAKIELALPSGWPTRAAIVRTEAESNAADAKRITQRRVYLRQTQ